MKGKYSILVWLIAVSVIIACSKEKGNQAGFTGTWIETSLREDTIVFEKYHLSDPPLNIFTLKRGKVLINGQWLPNSNSGPYTYYTTTDSIFLHWALSSSTLVKGYKFITAANGQSFVIGNFFLDGNPRRSELNFQKIQ